MNASTTVPTPSAPTAAANLAATPALSPQARFWNRIARRYAADPIADLAGYEATLQRVRTLLKPSDEVLEIGCGTGTTALRLADQVRHYAATDVAPQMVAIAREKLSAQPLPGLSFDVMDVEQPDLGLSRFDAVLAFNVLHLVHDLDQTLEQLLPSLKPGGLLIAKTACVAEMNPLVPWLAVPLMRAIGKAPPVQCFKAEHLQNTLQRHGLVLEATERHGTKKRDIRLFTVARKAGIVRRRAA